MSQRAWITALITVGGFVGLIAVTRGPPPPSATSPGAFSFAALGDAPYSWFDDRKYDVVLDDISAHDLSVVVHVGDILGSACTDARYGRTFDEFNRLPHPVVYTPGDNEWTDCWASGDFEPLDRLGRIREIFFDDPSSSLGGRPIPVVSQAESGTYGDFPENVRWTHQDVLFATVHLVGSENGTAEWPGRTEAQDAEAIRRMDAAVAWVRATFAEARANDAPAVVVAFHANPGFEEIRGPRSRVFAPFIITLIEEAEAFEGPVLAIHGDDHVYTVDHPLTSRVTLRPIGNVTRLQVPGSLDVGWVRVTVRPGSSDPFSFEPRVVPWWKYW